MGFRPEAQRRDRYAIAPTVEHNAREGLITMWRGYAEPVQHPAKGLDTSDGGKGKWKLFQGQPTTQGTFKNFKEFGV